MVILKKYKFEIIFGLFIITLYFFTRLYNILHLPIFTDEAIYIRWSQIAKQDASWRFISLTDGKQPMFVWIAIILLRLIHEPLLAGRMVSVLAGFGTVLGLFLLGSELFKNRWVGITAAFLYCLFPFGLVYDRMALYDSLVTTFAVWGWFLTILLVRKIRSDIAFILGLIMGGGFLTKSSDFFVAALMPFSLLLFNFRQKNYLSKLLQWVWLAALSIMLAFLYYSVLRLSPFFTIIGEKNSLFVYPFNEWLKHPFNYLADNLKGLNDWFPTYITLPVILLIVGSFIFIKDYLKEKILVLLWFITPYVYLAFFGARLYPRFILFNTTVLLILAAYTMVKLCVFLKQWYLKLIIIIIGISVSVFTDYYIITDISRAPIPNLDLKQYINDWPAGNGVKQAVAFFNAQSQSGKLYIGTEGTFGLMPYSLEMYLVDNPNIKIEGIWPINDALPKHLDQARKIMPTFVIFYQPCPSCLTPGDAPISWPLTLIAKYQQGIGQSYLAIYKVNK